MATRLNLPASESEDDNTATAADENRVESVAGPSNSRFSVSRREALGLAGLAVAGATPAGKALTNGLSSSFSLSTAGGKAVFRYRGRDCWVIDPKRFGGSAKLKVDRSDDRISIRLTNATYPGTDIPADLRADIRNGMTGWRMTLALGMARFQGKVDFQAWLSGSDKLTSAALFRKRTVGAGKAAALVIGGEGELTFSPDWTVRMGGAHVARLDGAGTANADNFTVRLLEASAPSLLRGKAARRTEVSMDRGRTVWTIDLPETPDGTKMVALEHGFDQLAVETRLTRTGAVEAAFEARALREGPSHHFHFSETVFGPDRKSFGLPVRDTRLAILDRDGQTETAFTASYHNEPAWVHVDRATLILGLDPRPEVKARPFLLHAVGSTVKLICEPAILGVAAGLDGAVVEPQPLRNPTHLEVVFGKAARKRDPRAGRLTIRNNGAKSDSVVHDLVVPNWVASILRPDDLLALRLEYYGYALEVGGGNPPYLVEDLQPGQANAYMIAYFAPQNIAEQAFFEQDPAGGVPANPGDPGQETPTSPGTVSRNIAGESRLAFNIYGASRIPYSIDPVPNIIITSARRKDKVTEGLNSGPTSVLDWTSFYQRVAPTALPPSETTSAAIAEPTADQTSIEAPFRLMLSPSLFAFWNHALEPKPGPGGEVELWHTRLGVTDLSGNTYDDNSTTFDDLRTVRAIWSPDYTTDYSNPPPEYSGGDPWNPYRASLDAQDRYQIVRLTSDYKSDQNGDNTLYTPIPASVNRLALSTLGAWLDIKGEWNTNLPSNLDIVEWIHRGTMARDHYVKVVYAGFLYPMGHKAVLIKVTERKFLRTLTATGGPGPIIAYLRQHEYIQVRQPVKTYNSSDYLPYQFDATSYPAGHYSPYWQSGFAGREMPFKTVKITSLVTPDIESPASSDSTVGLSGGGLGPQDGFWPRVLVNGKEKDFLWHCIGTDEDGNDAEFTMPMIFVSNNAALPPSPRKAILDTVNSKYLSTTATRLPSGPKNCLVAMKGQKIAFGPSDPGSKGTDPAVAVNTVNFIGRNPDDHYGPAIHSMDPSIPQFWPAFAASNASVPAIKHLIGTGDVNWVAAAQPYLYYGFDATKNKGEVFLNLVKPGYKSLTDPSQPVGLVFGKGNSGQVVTPGTISPNLSVAGLSRSIGPVGAALNSGVSDFSTLAGGTFNPAEFLGDPNNLLGGSLPKLFGAVSLTDLLSPIDEIQNYLDKIPGLKVTHTDSEVTVHYNWYTEQIKPWQFSGNPIPEGSPNEAVLTPWLIDEDGNQLLPVSLATAPAQYHPSQPQYQDGSGNLTCPPVDPQNGAPPPLPEVAVKDNSGSVDGGGDTPTHYWAYTYIHGDPNDSKTWVETPASLPNVLSLDNDSTVTVTVQQSNWATVGINIYRSQEGKAWPLCLLPPGNYSAQPGVNVPGSPAPTIPAANAKGTDTFDFDDQVADSDLLTDISPSTWMQFGIDMEVKIPLNGESPTYSIIGEVAYASLQMDVIAVPFVNLTFKLQSGQKMIVDANVNQIVFTGPLQFVNKLRDFLSAFDDPPFMDVSDSGIDAGYTLAIPTIAVGAFSLQNISLTAKVTVPFFGDSVVVGFAFCSKDNPFVLTIYIFGGGGWFEIDIAPDGLVGLHIGLEFGIDCALDLGVASGSVHVMAGIYYDYDKPSRTSSLTGFVDMGGSLDVLDLISVSVDFHMQLTYTNTAGQSSVTGEASLTVDVKVFFFSFSVTLGPIRKTFGGDQTSNPNVVRFERSFGNARIPIADMIQADNWDAYTAAFAA